MPMLGIYASASGMMAQQTSLDNTATNLANLDTPGFKRSEVSFQDVLAQSLRLPGAVGPGGAPLPTGLQLGGGVAVAGVTRVFTPGPLLQTGNPLDVAIQGEGFFQLAQPSGTLSYTRDGSFRLDGAGNLVHASGLPLAPALAVPPLATSLTIAADGTVSATVPGAAVPVVVGQIALARFLNPAGLSAQGRNLFGQTAASGPPLVAPAGQAGNGSLLQGFREGSNVEPVREVTNLLLARRFFELNANALRVEDSLLATATELIR